MSTRRQFLQQASGAGLAVASSVELVRAAADAGTAAAAAVRVSRAHRSGLRITSVIRREETVLRHGGFGDNWHMSWASDERQYVSLCDGTGFATRPREYYNSRLFAVSGGPNDAKFHDIPGYPRLTWPALDTPTQGLKDPRYYSFGTLALNSYLYQFMSTFNRPIRPDEIDKPNPNDLLRFNGAKLIYSPDNGRTWHNQDGSTPVVWEPWNGRSRETMVFFEEDQEAFSILSVLQMGKNYEHNRDGYLYVYGPNGTTEGTMNELVLFRAPTDKLLDRTSYEYFAGRSGNDARWSQDIAARVAVHTFPRGWVNTVAHPWAWVPSITYNAPLGLYMMTSWGNGIGPDGKWFVKPSYLGFWTAVNPWGPWHQIHEETRWMPAHDPKALAFAPQIAPKWIAADGKSLWLVWSDYQEVDEKSGRQSREDTRATTYEGEMESRVRWRRRHPYYGFNAQRVDLVIV